jgi:hypothetical protein
MGTWTATGSLVTGRSDHTAVLLPNGDVLAVGGYFIDGNLASAELYTSTAVMRFKSAGAQDGWVLETSETSNKGGTTNPTSATFLLGDTASKQQYRAILSFNTAALPDNAIITRVVLKIRRHSLIGVNPFTTQGKIAIDIRKGAFSKANPLQTTDFQAAADISGIGAFVNKPQPGGWYVTSLRPAAFPFVHRGGITQFRLRFQKDDDNDAVADFLRFFSGNALAASRPVLVISYYVP